jgi:cytochrome c oxidase subunit III
MAKREVNPVSDVPAAPEAHPAHPGFLHHHFDTVQQQYESDKLGMWLFLVTEILLFGGLFCAYSVYRANHPEIFIYAHKYLDKTLGGINTLVLICSSFTMAWAVRAAQLGQRRLLILLLSLTLLCGCGFLGIKAVEYEQKWKHGLLWGAKFNPREHALDEKQAAQPGPPAPGLPPAPAPPASPTAAPKSATPAQAAAAPAAASATAVAKPAAPSAAQPAAQPGAFVIEHSKFAPAAKGPPGLARLPDTGGKPLPAAILDQPKNVQLFFGIYFAMTGLHGIHVLAGMVVISIMLVMAVRGRFGPEYYTPVDLTGLYWHLVDLIWIYLFPLLYLVH